MPNTNSSTSGLLIKGFTCLGLSVMGFGSSLVPVKHLDTGDGMFFQFIFCSTLALESVLVFFIQGCPQIWSFSLVAGFLYAIGNLTVIPIMRTIGLGMGYLIWSVFSLLTAWATARYGWFGLDQQEVPSPTLNYIGTALATIGGCSLATFAGIIFGCSYTPILYIKNSSLRNGSYFYGASQFDLDYVFPYMTGVHTLNSTAFFVYCMGMKNLPILPINCVLPAFFSASLQFASQCCFFMACYCLGTIITYPIGTAVSFGF
ncbi:transmembrane protein 144-like [Aplochiton taeniatus]